jgi:putative tryptophan/tyrosine transport system substrate-binding protein
MERRMFLGTFAGGLLAAPLATRAQQPGKIPRLGMLSFTAPETEEENRRIEVFKKGLRERGYVQGQNIAIEPRHSAGRDELLPRLAAELVALKVDVILTYGTKATRAAKQATGTIPIVMLTALDPVGAGLVASLARPGGNITGSSEVSEELSAKRLDLLREAVPKAKRIAVLFEPSQPTNAADLKSTQVAAQALGMTVQSVQVRASNELDSAFAQMTGQPLDGLIVLPNTFLFTHRRHVLDLAAKHRLPVVYAWREGAEAGALLSYGVNIADNYRRAAALVDKILKGAKPGDLPIEQPTKFDLVINLKTAKVLGLTIPPSLLARADQVIE